MTPLDKVILLKLVLAFFLGLLIGLERKLSHKTAGMRTFSLISLGSALFVILSNDYLAKTAGAFGFDPSRVLSQIVVGLGFLGAGLIIFQEKEKKIHGLTTAASIWVAAGIGSAVGLGAYSLAVMTTLFTIFILFVLWQVEKFFGLTEDDK